MRVVRGRRRRGCGGAQPNRRPRPGDRLSGRLATATVRSCLIPRRIRAGPAALRRDRAKPRARPRARRHRRGRPRRDPRAVVLGLRVLVARRGGRARRGRDDRPDRARARRRGAAREAPLRGRLPRAPARAASTTARCWSGPAGVKAVYRKLHLFEREQEWFAPGNLPLAVHRVGRARVGMLICFDWRFPEAARVLALQGADVIAHPSNLVFENAQEAMRDARVREPRLHRDREPHRHREPPRRARAVHRPQPDRGPERRGGGARRPARRGGEGGAAAISRCARQGAHAATHLLTSRRPEFYREIIKRG